MNVTTLGLKLWSKVIYLKAASHLVLNYQYRQLPIELWSKVMLYLKAAAHLVLNYQYRQLPIELWSKVMLNLKAAAHLVLNYQKTAFC